MKQIIIDSKMRGITNAFTDEWVSNGYFVVARHMVANTDMELLEIGFSEVDVESMNRSVRNYGESGDHFEIFQSGFTYKDMTIFFSKHKELVGLNTRYVNGLGIERAVFDDDERIAKVFEAGSLVMLLMPQKVKGSKIEKQFPQFTLAY